MISNTNNKHIFSVFFMLFDTYIFIIITNFIFFAFFVLPVTLFLVTDKAFAVTCTNPREVCVEPGGIRTFSGVPVTLPCWRYETTWECHETSDNNCKQLRDQRCSQTDARCLKMFGGTCAIQEETYDCPSTQRGTATGIRIGDEFFCMSGDCSSVNPKSNKNFGKVAGYAAVLSAAAEDVKRQNISSPRIFTGKVIECSRNIANAKDCCANCGWAKGLLGGCADDEVELARAKESGLAIEAGNGSNNEYCHNRVLGVCTSYHRVYCVFPSKIAQIVQAEGRKRQLGIGFGDVGGDDAHPDCRGITPEELSRLNFERMDFRALYNDILRRAESSLPNPRIIEQKVSNSIREKYATAPKKD